MTGTANLALPYVTSGQAQGEVPHNTALDQLDARLESTLAVDLSAGNGSATLAQIQKAAVIVGSGATVARDLTLAAFTGYRLIRNTGTAIVTLKIGSASAAIQPGTIASIRGDGTTNGLEILSSGHVAGIEADVYDLALSTPDASLYTNGQIIARHAPVRSLILPASLSGSRAGCGVAPSADVSIAIKKNGSSVGSIDIANGATTATFTFAAAVTFTSSDMLTLVAPASADASLAGVWLTLKGRRG